MSPAQPSLNDDGPDRAGSDYAGQVGAAAGAAFKAGLYCAESVLTVLAREQGLESVLLTRAATGFCSGMGQSCGPCGALTGAVMGVGLALGRSEPGQSVQPAYAATRTLVAEFEREFGARDCHRLLGCDLGSEAGQAQFREQRLWQRCATYTAGAARIAARLIAEATPAESLRDA